jgi:cytoplasmic iron level regulating protein YaaA (DUF328/UPF0246 family)
MRTIVLISCVSKKRPGKSKVRDLYISPLFQKNLAYAQKLKPDVIYILSAKYGLLDLDTEIEPYDLTLNNMPAREIKVWAGKVLKQLSEQANIQQDHFVFLAGAKYRKYLTPHISSFEVPLKGMPIGKQLQYLGEI